MISQLVNPLFELAHDAPWLALIWIAFLGGCVGSFMNVVVYRVPAGMSLLRPGSQCPACGHAIRWYDNLPVLGWLRLHGKCRDCRAAISPRYPWVEALVSCLFVGFWIQDVDGAPSSQLTTGLFVFAWHTCMMCVLICAALIEFDGHPIPTSLVAFGSAVPVFMALLGTDAAARAMNAAAMTSVTETMSGGAVLAAVAAAIVQPPFGRRRRSSTDSTGGEAWQPLILAAMTGLYLGSGQAFVTTLLAGLFWRLTRFLRVRRGSGTPWSWFLAAMAWVTVTFPL